MIQVIKNALLTNGQKVDILIENSRIKDIVANAGGFYPVLLDAEGMFASPDGLIYIHTLFRSISLIAPHLIKLVIKLVSQL